MISGGADGSMILWDLENEDAEHKIAPANVVSKYASSVKDLVAQ